MLREPVLISTVTTIPGVRDRMLKVSFAVNGEGADLLRVRMGRELASSDRAGRPQAQLDAAIPRKARARCNLRRPAVGLPSNATQSRSL